MALHPFVALQWRPALRTLARHRGTYLSAAAILALGIGMSTAMFSLVDATLIRPLPFRDQGSLAVIWKSTPATGAQVQELAYPELRDLRDNIPDLESVAVLPTTLYGYARVLQRDAAEPVQIEGTPVSHDFFHVLGVAPALGRDFRRDDERTGAAPVVILSDRVWHEQFSADPSTIGRTIRLSGQSFEVIGVMPPAVEFPRGAGFWIPLGVESRIVERRGASFLQAIARVKPGRNLETVATEVDALFQRLAKDHPEVYPPDQRGVITPLVQYWTGSARLHLWIMLAASLLLLIAAAISAGNLLLSRTAARAGEFVTRIALGAARRQVFTQIFTEALIVSSIAAVAGLAIAQFATDALARSGPSEIPRLAQASVDFRAFAFAALASLLSAAACSLIAAGPAWRGAILPGALNSRSSHSRGVFLMAQSAATVMLLVIAALLTLSYRGILSADTGFSHRDAITMNLALRGPGVLAGQAFNKQSREAFYSTLLDRLRAAPGVTSAAAVLVRPLEGTIGWDTTYEFDFESGSRDVRSLPKANYEAVTPQYFATVGTPLIEGRDFDPRDSADSDHVAIVSEALARRMRAAGEPPVGSRIQLGLAGWCTIVGVTADARYRSVTHTGPDVFVPSAQANQPTNYVVIRGTAPQEELTAVVRQTLASLDPSQAISGIATIGDLIDRNAALHRFNMILLLWFGLCAAVLAAGGVQATVSESMALRQRETAIRLALGARRPHLVRQSLASTLAWVLAGEMAGTMLTALLSPSAQELLYGVSARDLRVLITVGTSLFLIATLAAFGPAWRASGEDCRSALQVR